MRMMIKNITHDFYYQETKATYGESKKEILRTIFESSKEALEGSNFKTEEERDRYEKRISEKVKLGEKLTPREMSYIQRTNPIMYMRIKRIQMQREVLERKLKQCKSKKEVEEAYNEAVSMIHKKDPDKQLLVSAYNTVTKEFKNTREYKSLPLERKDKENDKNTINKEAKKNIFDISVRRNKETTFDVTV